MKHSPGDPVQIGIATRASIERFLASTSCNLDPHFPERMEHFAAALALWGSKMNLTAHPQDPEEIAFHLIDSLMPVVIGADRTSALHGGFELGKDILDLGSGAGFPGLVLASATSAQFTLVEARRKRASFLRFAQGEMGLANITIEALRAEDLPEASTRYDLVTARALGDPEDFFVLANRVLKPDGIAMLYANPSQQHTQQFSAEVEIVAYAVPRRKSAVRRILAIRRPHVDKL